MKYLTIADIVAYTGATYTAEQETLLDDIETSLAGQMERYCNRKWKGAELFALKYDCDTTLENHIPPFVFQSGDPITQTINDGINKIVATGGSGQTGYSIGSLDLDNSIGSSLQFRLKVNTDLIDNGSSNGLFFSDGAIGFEFNWDANHIYINADISEVYSLNTKVWHTYKIDIITNKVKIYVDGELVISTEVNQEELDKTFSLYIEPNEAEDSEHEWDYIYITKGIRNYFTEKFDGGVNTFLVANPPIIEVISVSEDEEELVADEDYFNYGSYIKFPTKAFSGHQNVVIKYANEYFPDALKQALIQWILEVYETQLAGGGATVEVGEVKSVSVGPVSVTYGSPDSSEGSQTSSSSGLLSGVPEEVADVLRLYRKNPL